MSPKRLLDLTIGVMAVIALAPVLLVVAIALLITRGRPIFFRQTRPGLRERPFQLIKFRTMRDAFDDAGHPLPDAERLTRIGRFLRATSLDELPELWNVLRGEMSLVGPRPLLPQYLPRYTEFQRRRHEVKPGVTGWAQVNGRNGLSWQQKFEHDVWYVDHRSTLLDFRILWRTVVAVLKREGIASHGHATMPEFRGLER
jgi:sugar transferase EpsL